MPETVSLSRRLARFFAGLEYEATPPDWKRAAAHASELGLGNLAGRLESLA